MATEHRIIYESMPHGAVWMAPGALDANQIITPDRAGSHQITMQHPHDAGKPKTNRAREPSVVCTRTVCSLSSLGHPSRQDTPTRTHKPTDNPQPTITEPLNRQVPISPPLYKVSQTVSHADRETSGRQAHICSTHTYMSHKLSSPAALPAPMTKKGSRSKGQKQSNSVTQTQPMCYTKRERNRRKNQILLSPPLSPHPLQNKHTHNDRKTWMHQKTNRNTTQEQRTHTHTHTH